MIKNFFKTFLVEIYIGLKAKHHPFGKKPWGSRDKYLNLHADAKKKIYKEIDFFEEKKGYKIDRTWFEDLALHTQVVIKNSELNYQHGRLLYSSLRNYLITSKNETNDVVILESGTARGFSSVCMAKALIDSNKGGKIFTIDILPHNKPILWNCIDDHEGPKTRKDLLSKWSNEIKKIIFVQGHSRKRLPKMNLTRINFAFIDAMHEEEDVLSEYRYVCQKQKAGDIIIFDDVTPNLFEGVYRAVKKVEEENIYRVERITLSDQRGYAVATKKINFS